MGRTKSADQYLLTASSFIGCEARFPTQATCFRLNWGLLQTPRFRKVIHDAKAANCSKSIDRGTILATRDHDDPVNKNSPGLLLAAFKRTIDGMADLHAQIRRQSCVALPGPRYILISWGHPLATLLHGQMYRGAIAVTTDPKEAYAWSEVAMLGGNVFAQRDRDASFRDLSASDQKATIVRAREILKSIKSATTLPKVPELK